MTPPWIVRFLPIVTVLPSYEEMDSTFVLEVVQRVTLNKSTATVASSATTSLTATTVPAGGTVTWASSDTTKATVSNGTVTGVAAGKAIITASVEYDGETYTANCEVTVTA